jgi:tripartite tricarboxylate transporter family receptor
MCTRADSINQTLYKHPLYNFLPDFVPVVLIADQPGVLITRNEVPANSLPEFITYVKEHQATMQFASAGAGSTGHIDAALLNAAISVKVTHVPYRGGGPAMQDIIGGRVDHIVTLTGSVVPLIEGKTVKAIAVLNQGPRADAAAGQERLGTGLHRSRSINLVRLLRAQGHAGVDRQEAARRHRHCDGRRRGAEADAGGRRHQRPLERRSTEYLRAYVAKDVEKNAAPIRAAGLSME